MKKDEDAFRTIGEVSLSLDLPQHVLRFWEAKFPQLSPLKRGGGRRYYRPADIAVLTTIKRLLYEDGYTLKGAQRLLKSRGGHTRSAPQPASMSERDDGGSPASGPRDRIGEMADEVEECMRVLSDARRMAMEQAVDHYSVEAP